MSLWIIVSLVYLSIGFLLVASLTLYGIFRAPPGSEWRVNEIDIELALGMIVSTVAWPFLVASLLEDWWESVRPTLKTVIWRRKD